MVDKESVKNVVNFYGPSNQTISSIDEASAFIKVMADAVQQKADKEQIADRLAGLVIAIETMQEVYGITDNDVNKYVAAKQQRVTEKMLMKSFV